MEAGLAVVQVDENVVCVYKRKLSMLTKTLLFLQLESGTQKVQILEGSSEISCKFDQQK